MQSGARVAWHYRQVTSATPCIKHVLFYASNFVSEKLGVYKRGVNKNGIPVRKYKA